MVIVACGGPAAAALFAAGYAGAGKRALLVDGHTAQPLMTWRREAQKRGVVVPTVIVASRDADADTLRALASGFEVTVVDTTWPGGSLLGADGALVEGDEYPDAGDVLDLGLAPIAAEVRADWVLRVRMRTGFGAAVPKQQADVTVKVSMQELMKGMHTFVGEIHRSMLELSSTDTEVAGTLREKVRENVKSARALLGEHFKNGETFMVDDGARFFDATVRSERAFKDIEALLASMEQRSEITRQVPSLETSRATSRTSSTSSLCCARPRPHRGIDGEAPDWRRRCATAITPQWPRVATTTPCIALSAASPRRK